MLFSLYIFNVFAMGYVVFALERAYGTCMEYIDVVWLVAVTLTNLGYGEFTPRLGLRVLTGFVDRVRSRLKDIWARKTTDLVNSGLVQVSGYQERSYHAYLLLV